MYNKLTSKELARLISGEWEDLCAKENFIRSAPHNIKMGRNNPEAWDMVKEHFEKLACYTEAMQEVLTVELATVKLET